LPITTIFQFDFGTFLTVCYFIWIILLRMGNFECDF